MKSETTAKASEPEKVDAYMSNLKHPLAALAESVRQFILSCDKTIGEEIKWNAPAFFYTGSLKASDPKEYKRYLVVFNFGKKDLIRLVFVSGARVDDGSGLLEGDYSDGRRMVNFSSIDQLRSNEKKLKKIIKEWVRTIE